MTYKLGIKGNFPKFIKDIYQRPLSNITFNDKNLYDKYLQPPKPSLNSLLFNIVLDIMTNEQDKVKSLRIVNKVKLSSLDDNFRKSKN